MARIETIYNTNNKAKQITNNDGSIDLLSYDTIVAHITTNHELLKTWGGWSATTWRHIKTFCDLNGICCPTAKEWKEKNVTKPTF